MQHVAVQSVPEMKILSYLNADGPKGVFAFQVMEGSKIIERILSLTESKDISTIRANLFEMMLNSILKYVNTEPVIISVPEEFSLLIMTSMINKWADSQWKDSTGLFIPESRLWELIYQNINTIRTEKKIPITFVYEPKDPQIYTFNIDAANQVNKIQNPSKDTPEWKITGVQLEKAPISGYNRDNGKPTTGNELKGAMRVCQLLVESYPKREKCWSDMDWFSMEAAYELAKKTLAEG